MTTNITTLALNLLISERIDQRNILANRILELLNKENSSDYEKLLKESFLIALKKCIQNPNSKVRDAFYEHAEYFTQKISDLSSAA